jgi:hypothetical protein
MRIQLSSEFTHGARYGGKDKSVVEEKVSLRSAVKLKPL